MELNELKVYSQEEFQERINKDYTSEYKFIEKYGKKAKETFLKMSNSTETVHNDKLNKDLTLKCTLTVEKRESDGFVSLGATAYRIQLLDGEKELGKCLFQLETRGVHLSFIGLNEDLDESYQGKGIGSILIEKLEQLCKGFGAQYIHGNFTPLGKFANSSEEFYKRHGFKFDVDYEDHCRSTIYKKIESQPEQTTNPEEEKQ